MFSFSAIFYLIFFCVLLNKEGEATEMCILYRAWLYCCCIVCGWFLDFRSCFYCCFLIPQIPGGLVLLLITNMCVVYLHLGMHFLAHGFSSFFSWTLFFSWHKLVSSFVGFVTVMMLHSPIDTAVNLFGNEFLSLLSFCVQTMCLYRVLRI